MPPTTFPPAALEALGADVRAGHSCIVTYDHPDGVGWLDVFGPNGMRGGCDDGAFTAPVPTVRLWRPGGGAAPLAVAAANRAFPLELDRLAERARPLVRHEYPTLVVLLTTIREATSGLRFRVPTVGEIVTEEGAPALASWASCLPLGVLERCLDAARKSRLAA